MDIHNLIKHNSATRKYKSRSLSKKVLNKIIQAGIWGPSVANIQPWQFLLITNKSKIKRIGEFCIKKSKELETGGKYLLHSTGKIISNAPVIVLVFRTRELHNYLIKLNKRYNPYIEITEISACAASMQNMILAAANLKVGSCWFVAPVICKKKIAEYVKSKNDLLAVLTLGYAAEKGKRAKRDYLITMVKHF